MTYSVSLSSQAASYLRRADHQTQERIAKKIELLSGDPFDTLHSKRLRGRGGYRSARVGGLRVIFSVFQSELRIAVEHIAPRGQVYRDL